VSTTEDQVAGASADDERPSSDGATKTAIRQLPLAA